MDNQILQNAQLPFKGGSSITQFFGARPEYYRTYGLQGHEGVDLIPRGRDWTIYSLEDGIVTQDVDSPRSGAYGVYAVVWNRERQRAWWYCHMGQNFVQNGQYVRQGQPIGVMGNTGNSTGPHLHLGCRFSDPNGYPVRIDNGYIGFVNGLPLVIDINNALSQPKPQPYDPNPRGYTNKTHPYNQQPPQQTPQHTNETHPYNQQPRSSYTNETHPYNQQPRSRYTNETHPYNQQGGGNEYTFLTTPQGLPEQRDKQSEEPQDTSLAKEFLKLQHSKYSQDRWQSAKDIFAYIENLLHERDAKNKEIQNFKSLVKKMTKK